MNKETIRDVLEQCYWPEELKADEYQFRTQDDCDGDKGSGISVVIDRCGDAWIDSTTARHISARYRMPGSGGGQSPRTRNALVLLALAIKLDNETKGRVEVKNT